MRELKTVVAAVLVVFLATGCALQDRRWGSCAVGGGVLGAAIGGITGGVTVNNVEDNASNSDRGAAIGGGIVGGGLIGALLGHAICDPVKEAPPPPPAAPPPPPPPPAPRKGEPIATLHGAQFDFNKATLKPSGKQVLDEAAKLLKDKPDLKVSIEGHTDSVGSEAYNQKLSERRARAVRDYLVAQGIDAARMTVRGFGKSKPIATNDTEEGRAQNRRVEIVQR